jgi:hypothetical protein
MLAGIGIPLSIMFLAIVMGSNSDPRTLYALPLALSFMLFYLIKSFKKKTAVIVACLAFLTAAYQAQITAQLFYSDQIRYNEDVRFAFELEKLIVQAQPDGKKLPVALVGKYHAASRFHVNFIQGSVTGLSSFEWFDTPVHTTKHGLAFMKNLGIYFYMPDGNQLGQALEEAASMPPYPDPGCVRRMQDFIVVRISETIH